MRRANAGMQDSACLTSSQVIPSLLIRAENHTFNGKEREMRRKVNLTSSRNTLRIKSTVWVLFEDSHIQGNDDAFPVFHLLFLSQNLLKTEKYCVLFKNHSNADFNSLNM